MRQANAQVGVAIANRLPNITLSGNVGSQAHGDVAIVRPADRSLDHRRQSGAADLQCRHR